uniref:Ovule protein n=1 Tax=Rodentolepis nana TaxID=102285 RepID=A0A0R3TB78_RODNA
MRERHISFHTSPHRNGIKINKHNYITSTALHSNSNSPSSVETWSRDSSIKGIVVFVVSSDSPSRIDVNVCFPFSSSLIEPKLSEVSLKQV